MRALLRDFRYGLRLLVRNPGFTAVAVLTLALGIGANTAIFSVVHAVLLRPLPYANAERIALIWENNLGKGWEFFTVSPANFLDWTRQSRSFETLVALRGSVLVLTGEGEPERLPARMTTPGFFELTGVPPMLGRGFRPEEFQPGNDRVVVLTHGLWQRRFGGRPDAIGKSVTLGGESYTILGVLPQGFRIPGGSELLTPLVFSEEEAARRGSHYLVAMGKLKPGVTDKAAGAEMAGIAASLTAQYPDTNTGWSTRVVPLYEEVVGEIRPALLSLFAAVGFVLLIACGNVTNLLLARGSTRHKEIALRAALGAGRGRLVAQLLSESLLLSLAGGALGLLLGQWGIDLLRAIQPGDLPRMQEVGINATVLLFTLGLSLAAGLIFGTAPAFLISHAGLQDALKEGGRGAAGGRHRLRGALIVAQVALSLVLLVGAGLQVRSFLRVMDEDPGIDPEGVLTLGISLPEKKYPEGEPQAAFCRQALDRMRELPGVKVAAAGTIVPFGNADLIYSITVEGRPVPPGTEEPSANWSSVSPDYFKILGIPLVKGRLFTQRDDAAAVRVAIVNESFARRIFPGEDPIGKRIRMGISSNVIREIVGVVKDTKHYGLESAVTMQMYEPFDQIPNDTWSLLVKTDGDPSRLTASARKAIFSLDPEQPVSDARTLASLVSTSAAPRRFTTVLIGFFAVVALALAAVGIYGVVACSVAQRTREIGVRMALGAQRRDVLDMILRQGMVLVLGGVALGLAGAAALTRLISSLLYGVGALDTLTFSATSLILVAVALLACYLPARRAARVDPVVALRYE